MLSTQKFLWIHAIRSLSNPRDSTKYSNVNNLEIISIKLNHSGPNILLRGTPLRKGITYNPNWILNAIGPVMFWETSTSAPLRIEPRTRRMSGIDSSLATALQNSYSRIFQIINIGFNSFCGWLSLIDFWLLESPSWNYN